jgi:hypothetical protein
MSLVRLHTAAKAVDDPTGTDREPSSARSAFECTGTVESI